MAFPILDTTQDLVTLFALRPEPPPVPAERPFAVAVAEAGLKKRCGRCKEHKPLSAFSRDVRHRDGLHCHCLVCRSEARKATYHGDADLRRRHSIKHRLRSYGLTHEGFEAMLAAQDGRCDICRKVLVPGHRTHVDHSHNTGRVRALLCSNCNRMVGVVENRNVERLAIYEAYVRKHEG